MSTLEGRVSRVEGVLEQLNERLGAIERQMSERFARLEAQMQERFGAIERRQDDHFRWLVGIILIQWVTVLAAVLGALLTQ